MLAPIRIVVTGEHLDLESRFPSELGFNGRPLEWVSVPVLKFERLSVDSDLLTLFWENPPDWIIFSSARAVHFWTEALLEQGIDFPTHTRVACVGAKTAAAANLDGVTADFVPSSPGSETFLQEFEPLAKADLKGCRVFLPQAEGGRPLLRETLREWGCDVTAISLYRSLPREDISKYLTQEEVSATSLVLFTSPSSVDAFIKQFKIPKHVAIGCIGRFTADYLQRQGYQSRLLPEGDFERVGEIL